MHTNPSAGVPPLLTATPPAVAPRPIRAPTLYAIVAFKFLKGTLLLVGALVIYRMAGTEFREEFTRSLREMSLGDSPYLNDFTTWFESVRPQTIRLLAAGGVLYGLFSLTEGTGLFLRVTWAAWAAIVESAAFIPIEVVQMIRSFSISMVVILISNIAIVWYLWVNRHRLFHHHHHRHEPLAPPVI